MILERTHDVDYIKSVLAEMWDCVCEDGHTLNDYKVETEANCWIKMGDYGLYVLHPANGSTLEIHAFILPEHRKNHSLDTGKEILKWVANKSPEQYQKVIANVPHLYPNVKDFCIKNGFQIEGVNRLSHKKNGKLVDQWLLGITREEIVRLSCHS